MLTVNRRHSIHKQFQATRDRQICRAWRVERHDKTGRQHRSAPISTVGFGNNGLAKANLHGANDQKVLAGGDRESVGAGFTDSG